MPIANVRSAAVFTAAALIACAASADELYRQDGSTTAFGGPASQDAQNPGGLGWFAEAADNIPAEAGWTVDGVGFWGTYATTVGAEGNTEGFIIRFYNDAGDTPGALLFEQTVESFTEDLSWIAFPGVLDFATYEYSVELDPPFVVENTEQLWLSVVAILPRGGDAPPDEPQWFWSQATGVNPPPAQSWFFSPGNFQSQGHDLGLVLNGDSGDKCAPPDFDCDGSVGVSDLLFLLANWGPCADCAPGKCPADLDDDCIVGVSDLLILLASWG